MKEEKIAYQFLAEGFEEMEALAVLDVLRRGGVRVVNVSTTKELRVTGAHGVPVICDCIYNDIEPIEDADVLLLPGGMPGTTNLGKCVRLGSLLRRHNQAGKMIGAICAAPSVLAGLGILDGRHATCYPGFEESFHEGTEYTGDLVAVDGNIITGEGPAAALPYAYTLLAKLTSKDNAEQVATGMMYDHLMGE